MHALEEYVFSVGFSFGYKEIYIYLKSCYICYSEEGHGNPLLYSCLKNPMDGGAW